MLIGVWLPLRMPAKVPAWFDLRLMLIGVWLPLRMPAKVPAWFDLRLMLPYLSEQIFFFEYLVIKVLPEKLIGELSIKYRLTFRWL